MKKILALIIAVMFVLTFSCTAFAAGSEATITEITGTATKDVVINIAGTADTVYSVNVAWDDLTFTYTFDSDDKWDPETHTFTNKDESNWDKTTANVKVTNHSNAYLKADALFGTDSTKTLNNVTATLSSNTDMALATAVGTEVSAAPNATATVTISGVPSVTTGYTLDTITVSIKAGA